ncbi:hypothetical protein TWF730_003604 [Orbilia blumenaviensis]|uniref:Conserved oligomeric Golgi complex subunit 5 n=1 Tax=Orbilia blumenaviensis TaxID=1796055 RepID=A0AAV9U733_9PEZI
MNDPTVEVTAPDDGEDALNKVAPSYIDFDIFLDSEFSPYSFANTLIHATNNLSDTTLDLSTPLSRVLFDLQEIDTHIHTLTTSSAEPLLTHAKVSRDNSKLLVESIREQLTQLSASYARLSREVLDRHDAAKPLNTVVENLARTTRLLRGCTRCLLLGRQLEVQLSEAISTGAADDSRGPRRPRKEDPKALIRAAYTIVELRRMYSNATGEAPGLETLDVMKTLLNTVITPADRTIKSRAQQTIKEFSFASSSSASALSSSADKEPTTSETRSRATAAILVLHILSPTSYTPAAGVTSSSNAKAPASLLTSTITSYLQSQLTTSLASLSRSLTTLSTLDRTLTEVSTRAANIVALEKILQSIPANISTNPSQLTFSTPAFDPTSGLTDNSNTVDSSDEESEDGTEGDRPSGNKKEAQETLLTPLLSSLDTPSLTTHFFRTLASNLDPRVREIMSKGGLVAKNLRDSRDKVRNGLRDCVIRGVNAGNAAGSPSSRSGGTHQDGKGLEGLVGMMFGAVASLGR